MEETLRALGAQLFVYSPRQVDPKTGLVTGFEIGRSGFVPATKPVPEVNGSWFVGEDRSSGPTMNGWQFRSWATRWGIEIYPPNTFSGLLKDKFRTFRLIRDIDPELHPHTALYRGTNTQIRGFLRRSESVFVKPRFGSKGNNIFSVRPAPNGFRCTHYMEKQMEVALHPTLAGALAAVNSRVGTSQFLIQEGVSIDRYNDAPFIFRVIMLDDGEQWQWVHKAVLAAPGSEIANTAQGGSNWTIIELLTKIYGPDRASALFREIERVSFDRIRQLNDLFPGALMEVAFDFALDREQNLRVLEINTQPGMTKPGLPPEPAFSDIFNLQPSEREIYEKFVLPHGSCLARFLHSKLERRRTGAGRPPRRNAAANSRPRPAGVDALSALPAGTGLAEAAPAPPTDFLLADPEALPLHRVIARLAQYLVRACLADGSFRYRQNMNPDVEVKPQYNVLRHAGAIYALACHETWHASPEVRDSAQRAARFLKERCIAPIPGEDGLLGIWSRCEIDQKGRADHVRFGGVGVGLLALVGLERHLPGFTALDDLRALARFLLWGQREDGGFPSHYVPSAGTTREGRELYYLGQAASGLLALHGLDPSPRWVQAAADAVACSVQAGTSATDDHWTLFAITRLLPVYDECRPAVSRSGLVDHARKVSEYLVSGQIRNPVSPVLDGCLAPDGGTLATATGLQALLAVRTILAEDDPQLVERIHLTIERGIAFLMRACVPEGPYAGAMPRAIGPLPDDGSDSVRNFNRRATEIRVDYLQHALCAMIRYAQLQQQQGALTATDHSC